MNTVLNGEGFDVNERQLSKIRQKAGLWIRENRKEKHDPHETPSASNENNEGVEAVTGQKRRRDTGSEYGGVPPEVVAKRKEVHAKLMEESEDRLKSRTRRRRTRGYAGLPPDEGLGPRFPSELTLAEAIEDLDLSKDQYKEVRRSFEEICQSQNLVKKTICGPERWNEAKQLLISKFPQLQAIFWGSFAPYVNQTRKPMALDVVCMDVTKRLRTAGNYMTIAEAKNTLGLTPHEAREARASFDALLRANFFTGKLESTKQQWEDLKSDWVKGSMRLRMALARGEADPEYSSKVRAVEAMARDVQKRNRDNQTKHVFPRQKDSTNKSNANNGAESGTPKSVTQSTGQTQPQGRTAGNARRAGTNLAIQVDDATDMEEGSGYSNPIAALASQALASAPALEASNRDFAGMQIDPSLLEAAALPNHDDHHDADSEFLARMQQALLPDPIHKSVYFRLSSASARKFPSSPKVWLGTLPVENLDLASLRILALKGSGLEEAAMVSQIEGLRDGGGDKWTIDQDDELEAYLLMVGTGKATFILDLDSI